jgi:hypothetical protein
MNSRFSRLLFAAKVLLILTGMAWLPIQGLAQSDCKQEMQTMMRNSPNADKPITVSMSELRDNAAMYYGKTITVDGEMHRIFTDNIFTIEGGDWPHDFDVLIISNVPKADAVTPLEGSTEPDKDVRVTGVVVPYERGKLECAYGPLNLESREGASFTKSPVLIVEKGQSTERTKPSSQPSEAPKQKPY